MPERRIGRGRPQLATAWRTARCWNPACQPAAAREPASCARHRHGAWAEASALSATSAAVHAMLSAVAATGRARRYGGLLGD